MIDQMIAIDERYSIVRSKVMKYHETKLRKKLQELDAKRLNELNSLFKRMDKSPDKDLQSEASNEIEKHDPPVSSSHRNTSKSLETPAESEQIRAQSSNSSLQDSVPKNNNSGFVSNSPQGSPLQKILWRLLLPLLRWQI